MLTTPWDPSLNSLCPLAPLCTDLFQFLATLSKRCQSAPPQVCGPHSLVPILGDTCTAFSPFGLYPH